jgi:hypothetical protein
MGDYEIYYRNGGGPSHPGYMVPRLEGTTVATRSPDETRRRATRFVASAALSGIDAGILLDMLGLTAEEGKVHA